MKKGTARMSPNWMLKKKMKSTNKKEDCTRIYKIIDPPFRLKISWFSQGGVNYLEYPKT